MAGRARRRETQRLRRAPAVRTRRREGGAEGAARPGELARKVAARELAEKIFALRDNGATAAEIGEAVGRSAWSVRTFARQRGVVARRSATKTVDLIRRYPATARRSALLR